MDEKAMYSHGVSCQLHNTSMLPFDLPLSQRNRKHMDTCAAKWFVCHMPAHPITGTCSARGFRHFEAANIDVRAEPKPGLVLAHLLLHSCYRMYDFQYCIPYLSLPVQRNPRLPTELRHKRSYRYTRSYVYSWPALRLSVPPSPSDRIHRFSWDIVDYVAVLFKLPTIPTLAKFPILQRDPHRICRGIRFDSYVPLDSSHSK
mmetsp:Transcript_7430/g.10443  ORF Transcript_7430/g.10443 Transcript_7430/m.10443 type:complete len:202 (-) Transcript_7430:369-974(-)